MKRFLFIVNLFVLLVACSEPTDRIERKLETYLQEDLKFMVAETIRATGTDSTLLEKPYYRIKDFRLFSGAAAEIYAGYAEVDYFIYKNVAIHEKRKYRYEVASRHWDRYSKAFHYGLDTIP